MEVMDDLLFSEESITQIYGREQKNVLLIQSHFWFMAVASVMFF